MTDLIATIKRIYNNVKNDALKLRPSLLKRFNLKE